jgi:hypothetical protein
LAARVASGLRSHLFRECEGFAAWIVELRQLGEVHGHPPHPSLVSRLNGSPCGETLQSTLKFHP